MEKLITFAVPSYNSAAYMQRCIDTLLAAGEEAEIIIVNDGSKDRTGEIADDYARRYPTIVRAVHKENGGHGSGVNKGLELATGLYYKVVDSDDWLDEAALKKLMDTLRAHVAEGVEADMYIVNFIYDHVSDGTQYVTEYSKKLPVERFFGWNEMKPFRLWKVFMMHSLIHKTEALRRCGIRLPEHTFYVDNIYVYQPLPYMEKLYYLNVDLYHYFIGRSDQSVSIDNMVKRYDQQIRVMRQMLAAYSTEDLKKMPKGLRKHQYHDLMAILMNTVFFSTAKDSPERREAYNGMWKELKERDKKLYRKLKYRTLYVLLAFLPWKLKGWVTTMSYKFLCKHVKLGQ